MIAKGFRKRALLIGNGEFADPEFAALGKPKVDVARLAGVLRDPEIGGFEEVITLYDQTSDVIRRQVGHFFRDGDPESLCLVFYSGHGDKDLEGRLYLMARDSEKSNLRMTGIAAADLTAEMDSVTLGQKVLILDCCYAGAFYRGAKSSTSEPAAELSAAFRGNGRGRVIMAAASSAQQAWEPGPGECSIYTHYLVAGLTGGADLDGDGKITCDELHDWVYPQVTRWGHQTPEKWCLGQRGQVVLVDTESRLLTGWAAGGRTAGDRAASRPSDGPPRSQARAQESGGRVLVLMGILLALLVIVALQSFLDTQRRTPPVRSTETAPVDPPAPRTFAPKGPDGGSRPEQDDAAPAIYSCRITTSDDTCNGIDVEVLPEAVRRRAIVDLQASHRWQSLALRVLVCDPEGWSVHVGDSPTNAGYAGDAGSASHDAEAQTLNGRVTVYASDFGSSAAICQFSDSQPAGCRVQQHVISEDRYAFDENAADAGNPWGICEHPHLFDFPDYDEADREDPRGLHQDKLYLGLNRTFGNAGRVGSGVEETCVVLSTMAEFEEAAVRLACGF